MTREEAIDIILNDVNTHTVREGIALNMAIKALEQESTTKNDLEVDAVSRKAALDACHNFAIGILDDYYEKCLKQWIIDLPSVTPQESKSEWEHDHEILKAYSDGMNEVLDKIIADIQFIKDKCLPNTIAEEYEQKGLQEALDIIDKYKGESEG